MYCRYDRLSHTVSSLVWLVSVVTSCTTTQALQTSLHLPYRTQISTSLASSPSWDGDETSQEFYGLKKNADVDRQYPDEHHDHHHQHHQPQRRSFLFSVFSVGTLVPSQLHLYSQPVYAKTTPLTFTKQKVDQNQIPAQSITIPLQAVNSAYLITYRVESTIFRAVLDTGSPFLMIPGSCSANTRATSGCYKKQGMPSGYATTNERFDGFEGKMEWRVAPFSFVNATGSMIRSSPELVFGVVDDDIMSGPGGVFFGLIKNTDDWIRPSFLSQTDVTSMVIDLRTDKNQDISPSLTLSTKPLLSSNKWSDYDYIPMTNDLRRKYGDPVQHYTVKAQSIIIDGKPLIPTNRKPIYVIFDTGVTGMVVSQQLFDQRYKEARERKEKRLWGGTVELLFETNNKQIKSIVATKPLTTPFDPAENWKKFNRHVIVIGLSFLDSNKMTIDIDDGRLWVEA